MSVDIAIIYRYISIWKNDFFFMDSSLYPHAFYAIVYLRSGFLFGVFIFIVIILIIILIIIFNEVNFVLKHS